MHPLMPGERLSIRCQILGANPPSSIETPLAVNSPSEEAETRQVLDLPAPAPPIRFQRFLRHAVLRQEVKESAEPTAQPAIELAIEGPTQSFRRWLVADDSERNRLTSYIGTWRYMAVSDKKARDQLYEKFRTEFTREPMLVVSRLDGGEADRLPLAVDKVQNPGNLRATIRVRRFMPDYAMDRTTKAPVNQSDRRRNPAVFVEIEKDGKIETRWVFAKFPEFGLKDAESLPIRVVLDCPAEGAGDAPDFALVTMDQSTTELWTRAGGKTISQTIRPGESADVPGSQYKQRVAAFVRRGVLVESYLPDERGKAPPALEVEYTNENESASRVWLALGHHRTIQTPVGPMILSLDVQSQSQPAGHP